MPLVLLTFFILYSGMHLYAFIKAKAALAFSMGTSICLALFMAIMVAAPLLVRLTEKAGYGSYARLIAYIGYMWLGALFLFSSYSFAVDLYRLLVFAVRHMLQRDFSGLTLPQKYAFFIPLVLSILTSGYGYFEARAIRAERITIKTPKIPAEAGIIRIVQISDLHLGLIVREDRLRRVLKIVEEAHPDMLVSTGDLVDGELCDLSGLSDLFKEINPRFGKFAITGNHEFYAGIENSRCFTEDSGFTLLRGKAVTVAGIINIVGIDDPAGKTYGIKRDIPERELLSGLAREKFTLFLKHRPFVNKDALGLFNLQLSGHNHKGQIFPFSIITRLYYPFHTGFVGLSDNSFLYISRGAGTWGPPIRFLSPPEVAVIELVPASLPPSGLSSQ